MHVTHPGLCHFFHLSAIKMADIFTVVVASATASPCPIIQRPSDANQSRFDPKFGFDRGEETKIEYTSDRTSNEDKSISVSSNRSSSQISCSKPLRAVVMLPNDSSIGSLQESDSMNNKVNNNNCEEEGEGEEKADVVNQRDHEMTMNDTSSYRVADLVPTPSINKSSRTEQSTALTILTKTSTILNPIKSPPTQIYIKEAMEGYVKLIHRSDTQYLVTFEVFATPFARIIHDTKTRVVFTCDLDDVDFVDDSQCLFIKTLEIKVHITDPYFYVQFKQGCEEATYLTECKLRLGVMARDCYYTALLKGVDKHSKQQKYLTQDCFDAMKTSPFRESNCQQTMDAIIQEIIATKNTMNMDPRDVRQKHNTKGMIYNIVGDSSTHNNHRHNNKKRSSQYTSSSNAVTMKKPDVGPVYSDQMIFCLFCLVSRAVDKKRTYYLHPLVPHKHDGGSLFMCSPCLNNWQLYRETVAKNFGSLILPNEANEELCAICSDTPDELVLCSTCDKSYCEPCLSRTCSSRELIRVKSSDNEWSCMSCVSSIHYKSIQLMDKTTWIKVKAGYQGVILPKHIPKAKSNVKKERKDASRSSSNSSSASSQSFDTRPMLYDTGKADLNAMLMAGFDVQEYSPDEAETVPTFSMNVEREISGSMYTENLSSARRGVVRSRSRAGSCRRSRSRVKEVGVADLIARPPPVGAYTDSTRSSDDPKPKTKSKEKARDPSKGSKNKAKANSFEDRRDFSAVDHALDGERKLPAVTNNMSEDKYFASYVNYVDDFYDNDKGHTKTGSTTIFNTEDVCFLCKDGGDLMECDYARCKNKANCKCLKVYHDYCLAYAVPDGKIWFCPRHYCDNCASRSVKYVCKYCPVSVCIDCPNDMVKNYNISRYVSLETPKQGWEFGPDVQQIVCQTCLAMFTKCFKSSQREGSSGRLISLDHPAYKNQLRSFETLPSPVDKRAAAVRRQKLQQSQQQSGTTFFHNSSSSSSSSSVMAAYGVPPLDELFSDGRSNGFTRKRHRDDSPGYSKHYTSRARRTDLYEGDVDNQPGECLFLDSKPMQDGDLESIPESTSNNDLAGAVAVNQEDQMEADFANAGIPLN